MTLRILLGLLPLLHLTVAASYNQPCNPTTHCDTAVGLVCDAGLCRCSSGSLTNQVSYNLAWDSSRGICVGQHLSACTGTRQSPVPGGMKAVPCLDQLTCVQLRDMPMGVGSCENVPKVSLIGTTCSTDTFCDSSRSLVCTEGRCACATSRLNTSPEYQLVWDLDMNDCVAPIGAACVGTKEFPVAAGHKSIACILEADCLAVASQPPGLGICTSRSTPNSAELLHPGMLQLLISTCVIAMFR